MHLHRSHIFEQVVIHKYEPKVPDRFPLIHQYTVNFRYTIHNQEHYYNRNNPWRIDNKLGMYE